MKKTLETIWHALGAEHVITSATNSEELWQTYRRDRFFRWMIPTLAFVIVFAALMAINADASFALTMAVIITTGTALMMRKGVLTPEQTALAIEWGHMRKEIRRLQAFHLLVEACVKDETVLECPQDSKYFLPCRAEITRLRGLCIATRRNMRHREPCWWADDPTSTRR